MKFVAWQRPSSNALELKSISRYIATLRQEHTRLGNRLHAAQATHTTPLCIARDLKRTMVQIQRRILAMTRGALALIRQDVELQSKFESLIAIKGIAQTSAIQLLGELAGLDPSMTVRQWVAFSGLDPEHHESGTSVHPRSHISRHGNRHLRRALYMPALSGARFDPHMKAFYQQLQDRQKTKLQALMAVARKLLHAIFGIFKTATPYNGAKLFPNIQLITS
jgi:transposase